MKQIRKLVVDNYFFVFLLSLFSCGMFAYVSIASSNVPIMDYWRYANGLIEKSYGGGVTILDLCSFNGIHKSPLQLLFFLINVKVFHWNTQISMYLGVVMSCCSLILIYRIVDKSSINKRNAVISKITCTIVVFSMVPYEIIAQEFAFSAAFGIFVFVGLAYVVSDFLYCCTNKYDSRVWLICLFMFFVVNIIGGAFSVALSIAVLIVFVFDFIKKSVNKEKHNVWNYAILIVGNLLSLCMYFRGMELAMGSSGGSIGIVSMFKALIKGAVLICGTSLVGEYVPHVVVYIVGVILFLIHIILFVIYVANRLYEKTYIPAVLYLYYGIVYGMLFIGRTGDGVSYLLAPRYAKEAVFVLVADIVVLNLAIDCFKETGTRKKFIYMLSIVTIALINICICGADIRESHMAPYRKEYCNNLIETMYQIDDSTDDSLYGFQADSPDQVRSGVYIMKKYNLGVFNR